MIDAEITSKVAVQDAEVDAFYKKNIDRFKQGDTVRVSHIYFAVPPDAPATQKNQARAAAQDTLKQLKAGADFAKLAQGAVRRSERRERRRAAVLRPGGPAARLRERRLRAEAGRDERRRGARDRPAHRQAPRNTRAENGAARRSAREPEAISAGGQRQTRLDQLMGQIKAKTRSRSLSESQDRSSATRSTRRISSSIAERERLHQHARHVVSEVLDPSVIEVARQHDDRHLPRAPVLRQPLCQAPGRHRGQIQFRQNHLRRLGGDLRERLLASRGFDT